MKMKEFVFTCKGVRPQACVFPLSYVGSLRLRLLLSTATGEPTFEKFLQRAREASSRASGNPQKSAVASCYTANAVENLAF